MKIVCIGDSLTEGYPHDIRYSFPLVLQQSLQQKSRPAQFKSDQVGSKCQDFEAVDFEAVNLGVCGETSGEILARIERKSKEFWDSLGEGFVVTIMCGANDFIFTRRTVEKVFDSTMKLARLCRDKGGKVFLMASTLTNVKMAEIYWNIGEDVDYNVVNESLEKLRDLLIEGALAEGFGFVDVQREYQSFGQYVDGLHPTVEGYKVLADIVERNLIKNNSMEMDSI